MSLTFPSNPVIGQQTFTGTKTFEWDGERWNIVATPAVGPIGYTGSFNPLLPVTFSNTVTFKGSSTALPAVFYNALEYANVTATSASGTVNYYALNQTVLYYTSAAGGNFILNLTYSSTQTLNSVMSVGQTMTVVFMNTNTSGLYYPSAIRVDGTSVGVTVKWQGGYAPISGYTNSIDTYIFNILKTGASTFTVFGTQTTYK